MKRQRNLWVWVIPVLLLAAGLAAQQLADQPLDFNETWTKLVAGGAEDGPYSLIQAWTAVYQKDPYQAVGLALLYSVWGQVFGWSEFALRLPPLFSGLLALAWVYRSGRDIFAPLAGFVAVIFLVSSAFFINYMQVARSFTLVSLFVAMTLWGYFRLALSSPPYERDRAGQLAFLTGCIGIFYTHFYAVLFLVALGIWHLVFMPKGKRWWSPVWLFGLASIVFLAELGIFLRGLTKAQTAPWFTGDDIMRTAEVLPWFLYVLSNGVVNLSGMVASGALILLILAAVSFWWRFGLREPIHSFWFLLFTSLIVLLLMLTANEILTLIRRYRLRYLMALWPLIALLVGWGIWRTHGRLRLLAGTILGVLVVFGIWTNVEGEFRHEFYDPQERYSVYLANKEIKKYAGQSDLLLNNNRFGYYDIPFPEHQFIVRESMASQNEFSAAIQEHLRFWLLAADIDGIEHHTITAYLPTEMEYCGRFLDRANLVLELYAWSATHCPREQPAQMRFGEEIELAASAVAIVASDTLQVDLLMYSEESTAMTAYSVAVHVFDVESGAKVAQGDQGLWLGRYNPVRSEIDISALGAGEYEVRVGVYNWQTLERLEGVNLANGYTANLLTLFHLQIE